MLDRLRQPGYTGENRCILCTAANHRIQFDRETVESCCRSKSVLAATYRECDTRLVEARDAGDSTPPAG